MDVILASASPRRQELLRYIVPDFKVIPADVDESIPENIDVSDVAQYLACKKAEHIGKIYPDSLVIGSDTVVVVGDEILGKPSDEKEAYDMLSKLSGKVHRVITGVCLVQGDRKESFSQETKVRFYELDESEILGYIKTGDPMDKAGAYGIQGEGCVLVEGIEGDFFTVMGLPVARLKRVLGNF
ncbi:MAG: septum formation protein Maf [Oscillospiraceae bacterium]|nr:septum formation protein Maf [Ruminococcus sp.]MBQ9981030.1 septum formation protein Maf [Oscillospiraceae bacterium]MBR6599941.1 septum formation protein Maf [Oscillospiraceae bacterium]